MRIIGDQSREFRICPRMRERREHGDLGDMSQSDHRVTDLATMFRISHFGFPHESKLGLRQARTRWYANQSIVLIEPAPLFSD